MKSGRRSLPNRIIYGAIERITEKTGKQAAAPSTRSRRCSVALDSGGGRGEVAAAASAALPTRCVPADSNHAPPDAGGCAGSSSRARPQREVHGESPGARTARTPREPRGRACCEIIAPHGGGQQRLRAPPLAVRRHRYKIGHREVIGTCDAHEHYRKHRYLGAHRRREDDDDRAHPFYTGVSHKIGRGPRRRRRDGLHGAGAERGITITSAATNLLLEGGWTGLPPAPHQHHRHAPGTSTSPSRSRALAARARRRRRRVRRWQRRRAAVGDGVAAGEQVPACRASRSSTRWTAPAPTSCAASPSDPSASRQPPVAIQLPIGRGPAHWRHRPHPR